MAVLTMRIALEGITPVIWRSFKIDASASFHDLHKVIQACMGWEDCHLYEFTYGSRTLVHKPEEADEGDEAEKVSVRELIPAKKATYLYDFGDNWEHTLVVEDVSEGSLDVPVCIDGVRACPPEDVGSVSGYRHLLKVLKDPAHKERDDLMEWLGKEYNPEAFDVEEANRDIRDEWGVALPLSPLFIPQKSKLPKSLLNHEMDYAPYLWAIESNVVGAFIDDRNITDADVVVVLKGLKANPDRCEGLGALVANDLHFRIMKMPISRQEFNLVIDHLLWSIDNRSWNPDRQAYLKWAAWHFGAFDKEESKQYEKEITLLCKKHGVPKNMIEAVLGRSDEEPSEQARAYGENESEYFSLPEERRDEFVLGHVVDDPWLFDRHIKTLVVAGNHERLRRVLEALMQASPGSPIYTGLLAEACAKTGDKESAVKWYREAVRRLDSFKDLMMKEKRELRTIYEEQIKRLSR